MMATISAGGWYVSNSSLLCRIKKLLTENDEYDRSSPVPWREQHWRSGCWRADVSTAITLHSN